MKINLLLIIIFLSFLFFAGVNFEHGLVGLTRLNGEGCQCHGVELTDSVYVWIEGPDSLFAGETTNYKILMSGGPAVNGGFNVAAIFGALESVDSLSQTILYLDSLPLQLTHTMPNPFVNDTVLWNFSYTAPDSIVADTIYSVANSVNGDGNPQVGDEWNFGENFPITIVKVPVIVEDKSIPKDFYLAQNYPNPFNPNTIIQYAVGSRQFVSLKVYDVLGNEITTLVNEAKPAGIYQVIFNGINLPSGIYVYKLQSGNFVESKKMVLTK
jgi:hypothetical protein